MTIQGVNNTAGTLTYSAESITITSGSTVTIPTNQLFAFFTDPNVISDISLGNLSLSDTVTIYSRNDAINFVVLNLNLYLSNQILSGLITYKTVPGFTGLSASSPTAATVGVSSAQALAANSSRKGLILVNTSKNIISLGLDATAVLYSGITLAPGGTFEMDSYCFTTGAINAIASAASSNLAIQEYS